MTQQNTTDTIRACLGKMAAGDLTGASTQLLAALGYRSDRLLDGQTGNVGHFIADFKADNADTRSEQGFRDSAKEVRILFQFTDTEIAATGQRMMFDAEGFSAGNASSFLFAAVDLNGDTYPRGRYVSFTREINKRFNRMPAAIVFRTADPARYGMTARSLAACRSSARSTPPTRTAPTWTSWPNYPCRTA